MTAWCATAWPAALRWKRHAAIAIGAHGYGECSAKTGDNVQAVWEGIVNYVVAGINEHEQARANKGGKRAKVKTVLASVLSKFGLAWVRK